MRRRVNSYNTSSRPHRRERPARVIVTALAERDERLLLVQLAQGKFAGFWLLPSATVEEGSVAQTAQAMFRERTGLAVDDCALQSVVEEPRPGVLALRMVFAIAAGGVVNDDLDPEIAKTGWFTREDVRELLAEREVVPTLGVMALVRAWAEGTPLPALQTLVEDSLCPCGSGFRYPGCCGWDMKS